MRCHSILDLILGGNWPCRASTMPARLLVWVHKIDESKTMELCLCRSSL